MPAVICLDGPLTIGTADPIRGRILEALGQHRAIEIDCAADSETDISFVQILIATHILAKQQDRLLTISGRFQLIVRNLMERAGLPGSFSSDVLSFDKASIGKSAP
ncbi:STAS domain-containing protein [Rhodovastum atsumiense]|nr:STAS domain-containing protein [Rhodovastum atsumiense]